MGSSPTVRTRARRAAQLGAAALFAAGLAACDARREDEGPVAVSVIGSPPRLVDPNRASPGPASLVLLGAVAQGLVRFDAAGQVEPALAESWIVIGDGSSIILRLADARWTDGRRVTADDVAARLRAAIAPRSRNPLRPFLTAIDEIVVMTPEVIEIRLGSPRPELLRLLAQPELAILSPGGAIGSGPFAVAGRDGPAVRLRPAADPDAPDDAEPDPRATVVLRGERAALAIARFAAGGADLVTGGGFDDRPLLAAADIPARLIRGEAVTGLFGLAVVDRSGFLADAENRMALAMAIDRSAIATSLGSDWRAIQTILPAAFDSASAPAEPGWSALSLADRRTAAAGRIATWRVGNSDSPPLRIALPDGPGATLLFARLRADLALVGLSTVRVPSTAAADLRLVDRIAPSDNARWFLASACRPCGEAATAALDAARVAETTEQRAQRLADADVAVTADAAFVPLAGPVRWSLVSPRLRQWTANPRGAHPLNHLRATPN